MAMSKFWWKSDSSKDKSIHWMCWSRLTAAKCKGGMGFKNLRDFNTALLGNQAWRLISFPDKLLNWDPTLSYIWRSVMEAQALLVQGISCCIGNGQTVDITNSPWLPSIEDPFVHSDNKAISNQKVISLFKIDEKAWDIELVLDVFEERDAELILSIPLTENDKDTWYWRHEKMGHYSVKSGYNVIQASKNQPNTVDNSRFWRKLWNLKIPNKARRIQVNAQCPVCNLCDESAIHSLVTFSFAVECHQFSSVKQVAGDYHIFTEWLQMVFEQSNNRDICIQEDGLEQWCPTSSNSVKVNVDAALFTDPNRYNYAIVVRDHLGHLVQAMSKCSLGKVVSRAIRECRHQRSP
ncbi:uncharacterized protein LOC141696142 [Apium graveolens]|uniref:uncharacterized protein LOC141696142 n=1 Tax=Apium graveolens TaxID=4045 RepID=UPI003D7B2BC4